MCDRISVLGDTTEVIHNIFFRVQEDFTVLPHIELLITCPDLLKTAMLYKFLIFTVFPCWQHLHLLFQAELSSEFIFMFGGEGVERNDFSFKAGKCNDWHVHLS